MIKETLQQATNLDRQLKDAKSILSMWQKAEHLGNKSIYVATTTSNDSRDNVWLSHSPESFVVIKSLNVAYYQDLVDNLQREFDAL